MLILTRRLEEKIIIDDDITISVLGIQGNQVRLGIDAPREKSVHRKEIYDRIKKIGLVENTAAEENVEAVAEKVVEAAAQTFIAEATHTKSKEPRITIKKFRMPSHVSDRVENQKMPMAAAA